MVPARTPQLLALTILLHFVTIGRSQEKGSNISSMCDSPCICRHDPPNLIVDCSNNQLSEIPPVEFWPVGVHTMDLSSNQIETLGVTLNQSNVEIASLKVLKLSKNSLKHIDPLLLNRLAPQLEVLDLSYNKLSELNDLVFHGLEHLCVLNLSYNELRRIPDMTFATLTGLQELILSSNEIHSVSNNLMQPLRRLRTLKLSNIEAHHLNGDVFNSLDYLTSLDLSRNKFFEVPIDALRSARFLEILDLSQNPIVELADRSFRGLDTLQFLYLEEMNDLCCIRKDAFYPLKKLKVLKVKNCPRFSMVDPQAFEKLFDDPRRIELEEVDFSSNALKSVDPKLLAWGAIKYINFQNNPWDCNCEMGWILNITLNELLTASLRCHQPPELQGKNLLDLTPDQFQCSMMAWDNLEAEARHQRKVVQALSLMIGVMGMFLVGLLLVVYLKRRQLKQWWFYRKRKDGAIYYVRANTSPAPIDKQDMYSNNIVD